MAVTQAVTDRGGISNVCVKDDDGYWYRQMGPIRLYFGTGSPNAIITAPIGSEYIDSTSGVIYRNSTGTTTWQTVTQ